MRNRSENQITTEITLYLIRHGATISNEEHRYLGQREEALSAGGAETLNRMRKAKVYKPVDCVFASPMKRCMETARILYPDHSPQLISQWKEMDFGDFEGKNYKELQNNEMYQRWIDSGGTLPFPNGESREDFEKRCRQGFYRMYGQLKKTQTTMGEKLTAGVVVHGGTIMALLSAFYGGSYFDYQTGNGQGYECVLKKIQGKLRLTEVVPIGNSSTGVSPIGDTPMRKV